MMAAGIRCFRAAQFLSLINIVIQVPPSSAHPLLPDSPPTDPILADPETTTLPLTGNIAYEISDGQVQAAISTFQDTLPSTSPMSNGQNQASHPDGPADTTTIFQTLPLSSSSSILAASSTLSVVTASELSASAVIYGETISSSTATASELSTSAGVYGQTSSSSTVTTVEKIPIPDSALSESPPYSTSVPDSSLMSNSVSEVQTGTDPATPSTSVSSTTALETSGQGSSLPFATSIASATSALTLVDASSFAPPTATSAITELSASDIFVAIATGAPPSHIPQRSDHPVPRLGIQDQSQKLQTNKFYTNLFVGNQDQSVFTFPYSVVWARGSGDAGSWGLSVSHAERNQFAYGPPQSKDAGASSFFASPLGVQSVILSAAELTSTPDGTPGLTTDSADSFSINVNLYAHGWQTPTMEFPLVQGSAFITGKYHWATPLLQTGVGFDSITYVGDVIANTTFKYRVVLRNGYTWLVYISPSFDKSPGYEAHRFTLIDGAVQGPSGFNGIIQVAKVPGDSSTAPDCESIYDSSAGTYSTGAKITGTVDGTTGSYTFHWSREGVSSQSLLMFALPHHLKSFSGDTLACLTDLQLMTPVKGLATAMRGDSWTLVESSLPIDMAFAPWSPTLGSVKSVSNSAAEAVYRAGLAELQQDIAKQSNVGSMYFDGKALAKFAAIIYTMHDIADNRTLALSGLQVLEQAFALHVNNGMTFPLVYESAWGGVVSSAAYTTGDALADFGNTYYNDHHFHYAYFVYVAAVIGYLDSEWLTDDNVAWVNMLVRDYANPIKDDPYYPFSRNFDWYHGHSWAGGLFAAADGKNQESSSEDTMASYSLKMWGQVVNDKNMEARGNLMLAIQARSLQDYYLYEDSNTVMPPEFIGNKAAGILFENKVDHTTYFGANKEYIQGIHMLPLMPFSTYIRTPTFVQEEWDAYFAKDRYIDSVQGGWRGILMGNYATVNASAGYQFFSDPAFDSTFLDGGASQSWYLAWAAALGGATS